MHTRLRNKMQRTGDAVLTLLIIAATSCSGRETSHGVPLEDAGSTSGGSRSDASVVGDGGGSEGSAPSFDAAVVTIPELDASVSARDASVVDTEAAFDAQVGLDGSALPDAALNPPRPWACPTELPEALPTQPEGWAGVEAYGTETTVGGLGGEVVSATTDEELRELVAGTTPRIIGICGTIQLGSRLVVGSNKTLVGLGEDALIRGGLDVFGSRNAYVSNVIIRNLTIDASTVDGFSPESLAAIRTEYAHHVWLDHLELYNARRGLVDVVFGSDLVTISWSKFYFTETTPDAEHRFGIRIGETDDASVFARDGGKLRVTLHHNWFAEYIRQRFPRVTYGQAHIVNNYYSTVGNDTAIWGASQFASLLIEGNYFKGTTNPHEIVLDEMAQIVARNNIYDGTIGAMDTNGAVFEPEYVFPLDDAAAIPALVPWGAGPAGGNGPLPALEAGVDPVLDSGSGELGGADAGDAGTVDSGAVDSSAVDSSAVDSSAVDSSAVDSSDLDGG